MRVKPSENADREGRSAYLGWLGQGDGMPKIESMAVKPGRAGACVCDAKRRFGRAPGVATRN
jgi:hypothetical protein